MISTKKDIFITYFALAIFDESLSLNTFNKCLKPIIYELVINLNKGYKLPNRYTLAKKLINKCYETI